MYKYSRLRLLGSHKALSDKQRQAFPCLVHSRTQHTQSGQLGDKMRLYCRPA